MEKWKDRFGVIAFVCLLAIGAMAATYYHIDRQIVDLGKRQWCKDYQFGIGAQATGIDYDTIGFSFQFLSGACETDSTFWIKFVNVGKVGDSGACSLNFKNYDGGYDSLGTCKFVLADSGTMYLRASTSIDTFIVWHQDSIDSLQISGYTIKQN